MHTFSFHSFADADGTVSLFEANGVSLISALPWFERGLREGEIVNHSSS